MMRAVRAFVALALLAAVGIGAIAVRERTKTVLDDFEGRVRLYDWSFEAGLPGQGAKGLFRRSRSAARSGSFGGEIRFDFTGGGAYVQATLPTRWIGPAGGVSFWVRASAGALLAIRVRDRSDQVFQREIGFAPREWSHIAVSFSEWTDSYGGPGDGIMRGPPRAVALVVANTSPQRVGYVHIDDVRRLPQRNARNPWYSHVAARPRLLISGADLVRRRRTIVSTPWLRRLAADLAGEVREEHRKGVRVPAATGQCEQWYACPVHGATLRMEGPRRHVCPADGRVFSGWPYDDVWTTKEHKRLARLCRQAAVVYALTDDSAALSVARSIVTQYAARYRNYPQHDIHGRPGRGGKVLAQSLDDAAWLVPILQAADLIWERLTAADRARITNDLIGPAINEVIRTNRLRFHNIQCWHDAAIGLAGLLIGDAAMVAEAYDGVRGFDAQLRHMVDQDGMWTEGSWGYHYYALEALWSLAQAAHACGYDNALNDLRPMFLAPLKCAMPNGALPRFNDDTGTDPAAKPIYEAAVAYLGNAELALPVARSTRNSIHTLLYGLADLPQAQPVRGPRVMPDSGYAILASRPDDAAWVCLKYGRHGGDHSHADKNSIVAFGHGEVVLDDPGIGPYLTGLADGWFKTAPAHNAACVPVVGQRPAVGSAVAFSEMTEGSAAISDAGFALDGIRHLRAAFLIGDHTLVTADLLTSRDAKPRVCDVFWRPAGRLASEPDGDVFQPPKAPGYAYLRGMRSLSLPPTGRAFRFTGMGAAHRPRWISVMSSEPQTKVVVGSGPGSDTGNRVPIVMIRTRAVSSALVTAVTLKPSARPARVALLPWEDEGGGPRSDAPVWGAYVSNQTGRWLVVANPERRRVAFSGWHGADAVVIKRLPLRGNLGQE